MAKQKNSSKGIVKKIFERPKGTDNKVSALFRDFKHPSRSLPSKKAKKFSFLKKLPAAIDIGTSSIKLIQLAEDSRGELQVLYIDREKYPKENFSDNSHRGEALKKIVERNKIGHEVVTAISIKDVQIYNLNFPPMSEPELNEAVRWKITQLKPFGLDIEVILYDFIKWDNVFDTKPPEAATASIAEGESTQQKVVVACVPRNVIRDMLLLFRKVGLKPVAIDIAPVSLANLDKFRRSNSMKDEIVMRLDVGAEESTLVIARAGNLYFCRNLAFSSRHMTDQIARRCHLTRQEAEDAKKEHGLTFWSPDKKPSASLEPGQEFRKPEDQSSMVYYGIISFLENLIVDVEHSFKYFSYQVSQSRITKFDCLIISGGGSNLKNLERFLGARLDIPIEKVDPLSFFTFSDSLRAQKRELFASSSEFAVCAGLAVSRKIAAKRINLMPQESKKDKRILVKHPRQWSGKIVVLALLLIAFSIGLQIKRKESYRWKTESIAKQVKAAKVQLTSLQAEQLNLTKEENKFLDEEIRLQARLNFLKQAVRRPDKLSTALAGLTSLLPKDVWITQLSYLEEKLTIKGSTADTNLVMQLMATLRTSDKFANATFSHTQRKPDTTVYDFEVIVEIKP